MITLQYPKNRNPDGTFRIDGYTLELEIDAAPSERYNFFAQSTENPIERSAVLSDHTIVNPETISFDCVITNTPTLVRDTFPYEYNQSAFPSFIEATPPDNRVTRAYELLRALRDFSPPVRIITGWGPEFPDMVVEIFSIRRDISTTHSLVFQLGLKRVHTAFAVAVGEENQPEDPLEDRAKASGARGNQPSKQAESTKQEASLKAKTEDIGLLERAADVLGIGDATR